MALVDISLFDHNTLLSIGVNLVLIGIGWGRLYAQVREVSKWKENQENNPLNIQLQTGLVKQAEVFERFNDNFKRLDEQVKGLLKEPVELVMSRFENRFESNLRRDFADRESISHQFDVVKEIIRQLDLRVGRDAEHIQIIIKHIFENKVKNS